MAKADKSAIQLRGQQAEAILKNPVWEDAFSKLDKQIVDGWRESLPDHADAREQFWHLQQALLTVKETLEHYFISGENARKELLLEAKSRETTK